MNRPPSPYAMAEALKALRDARERLLAVDSDIEQDERLFSDMMDGESGDAFAVLDRAIRASIETSALIGVLQERMAALQQRKARFERRRDAYRSMVLEAMQTMGIEKLERPDFTATVRSGGTPGVVIVDEARLPDAFVRIRREPDKATIGAALKAGNTVDGAELRNSAPGLQVKAT